MTALTLDPALQTYQHLSGPSNRSESYKENNENPLEKESLIAGYLSTLKALVKEYNDRNRGSTTPLRLEFSDDTLATTEDENPRRGTLQAKMLPGDQHRKMMIFGNLLKSP